MFKTIVVGVDGREGGRDALSLGGRLALVAGGELVAVRVLSFDQYVVRGEVPHANSFAEQEAQRMLEDELAEAQLSARTLVARDRSPARALHHMAEELRADVIVVGSTHHGPVGRVLAGDDAVATLHGSGCPVAVAPRGLAAAEWKPVQRIGVGFDAGPEAEQALALAVALAVECGASLDVRSVIPWPITAAQPTAYDQEWFDRSAAIAQGQVDDAIAGLPVETSGAVVTGSTVEELAELSTTVDLLVVGSRAWGPVRRIILGSTAARLIHSAHCPVLVLPRGAATGAPGERDLAADRGGTKTAA